MLPTLTTAAQALRFVREAEPCAFVRLQTPQELIQIRFEGLAPAAGGCGVQPEYAVWMRSGGLWLPVGEKLLLEWLRDRGPFVAEIVPESERRIGYAR